MKAEYIFLIVVFFIALFSNIIISDSSDPFTTGITCSKEWGFQCGNVSTNGTNYSNYISNQLPYRGHNKAFPQLGCDGTLFSTISGVYINEIYLNQSSVLFGSAINATCEFYQSGAFYQSEYMLYDNDSSDTSNSNWILLWNQTGVHSSCGGGFSACNYSVVFVPNSTQDTQIVRCIIESNGSSTPTDTALPSGSYCANSSNVILANIILDGGDGAWDNGDVNFTVTAHLTYDFWNLTSYTTGENISSGQTYNRTDSSGNITYINVSAHWNKNISLAQIEHNGTGTFMNYTVCSYPNCTGGWTNYTLNLSNASEFNAQTIEVRSIYVNDTTTVTNNTSPYFYFNLWIGSAPNITSYWLSPPTNKTNLYTNLTIYANVSDEVGITSVTANITYPDNSSRLLNFTGNPYRGNQTWDFTFDTQNTTLNETGNYTVWWVMVNNTGDLATNLTSNLNFTVYDDLDLGATVSPTNPSLSSAYTTSIDVYDVNGARHQLPVNLTIICDKTYDYNNSASLANVNGSTSLGSCVSPGSYGDFSMTINASDAYNNSGQQSFTFYTVSAPAHISGGGGGGGGATPTVIKRCSDNTTYDTCNPNRKPYYCSNGTLIQNCGTCGCINANYSCQPDGSCILVREGDFNFTLNTESIEIEQGSDGEVQGVLTNTGNKNLSLTTFVNVSGGCCNVSVPQSIALNLGENTFPIPIHIPIFTSVGTYDINIGIGLGSVIKEKIITANVIASHYYSDLSDINSSLDVLEKQVQDYKMSGIDTENLDSLIQQSQTLLATANSSISKDDVKVLASSLSEASSNARYVTTSLNNLILKKFMTDYSWLIIALIISIFSTLYLVPEVFMPLYQIDKEVRKLKSEEKDLIASRVETEKQYFMRKIDENTFSKIMITKQDRILRVRGMIKNHEESVKNILENRLKPKGIVMTLKQNITSIKVFKKKSEN